MHDILDCLLKAADSPPEHLQLLVALRANIHRPNRVIDRVIRTFCASIARHYNYETIRPEDKDGQWDLALDAHGVKGRTEDSILDTYADIIGGAEVVNELAALSPYCMGSRVIAATCSIENIRKRLQQLKFVSLIGGIDTIHMHLTVHAHTRYTGKLCRRYDGVDATANTLSERMPNAGAKTYDVVELRKVARLRETYNDDEPRANWRENYIDEDHIDLDLSLIHI